MRHIFRGVATALLGSFVLLACAAQRAGDALNQAGQLYQAGRYEEALAAYKESIAGTPSYGWAHFGAGNCLRALKRNAEAIDAYRQAVRLMPENAEAQYWLGAMLYEERRDQDAIASLNEAIRLSPDDWKGHAQLGLALARAGRDDAALEEFETASRLSPNWPGSWPEAAAQYRSLKNAARK